MYLKTRFDIFKSVGQDIYKVMNNNTKYDYRRTTTRHNKNCNSHSEKKTDQLILKEMHSKNNFEFFYRISNHIN